MRFWNRLCRRSIRQSGDALLMKTTLCLITPIRKEKFLFRDSMEQIALRRSFFLQKTRFGNGNKTIAGFQTPAQTALFACSHMPEKPAASFGLFTGARGLEGARPSSSLERQVLAEVQHPASSRSRTREVGISCRGGRFVIDSPGV